MEPTNSQIARGIKTLLKQAKREERKLCKVVCGTLLGFDDPRYTDQVEIIEQLQRQLAEYK